MRVNVKTRPFNFDWEKKMHKKKFNSCSIATPCFCLKKILMKEVFIRFCLFKGF